MSWLNWFINKDVSDQMAEACNAVRKQGKKGYLSIKADPQTGEEEICHVSHRGGKLQHKRMLAVDNLVRMTGENCDDVMDFLSEQTHCAHTVRQHSEADDVYGDW
jgi:hypothetical protein